MFPGAPHLVKGGIVLLNPVSSAVLRVIPFQYNPDTLTRTVQMQGTGGEGGDRLEALRLKGPPVETLKLDVEIDATDQWEFPEQNPDAIAFGIQPQLAALETILYPDSASVQATNQLAQAGVLEVLPMTSPLVLFIWSKNRIVPVRITEFTITEEAFDPRLNPIRAKVSLGMRILSVNDLDFASKGNSLFMIYHQQKEKLAKKITGTNLNTFGIGALP
jgi:hypothetical protein